MIIIRAGGRGLLIEIAASLNNREVIETLFQIIFLSNEIKDLYLWKCP